MLLKKKVFILFIILLTSVSALWAGDTAVFVDLGFSTDGRMYMFGQHGVLSPSLRPWANLYIVDVSSNTFAQNGRVSLIENTPIKAGQDGSGILHKLISNNSSLTKRYGINFQNQGLPLYISRDEFPSPCGEKIDFRRNFISGEKFIVNLIPTITGSGQNVSSSFYINMEIVSSNGQVKKSYTVGTPGYVRQKIASYNIKKVLIDATESSIIFVVEMKRVAENGYDIRYMVETVRL